MPSGTSFDIDGNAVIGVYWENKWGVHDLDLSTIGVSIIFWGYDTST